MLQDMIIFFNELCIFAFSWSLVIHVPITSRPGVLSQKQHIAPRSEASESADKQSKKYLGSDNVIFSYEVISGLILNYFCCCFVVSFCWFCHTGLFSINFDYFEQSLFSVHFDDWVRGHVQYVFLDKKDLCSLWATRVNINRKRVFH